MRRRWGGGCLRWAARGAFVVFLLVILAVGYLLLEEEETATPVEPATTQGGRDRTAMSAGLIKVYFTTPTLVYPDRRNQRQPSPVLDAVIADISAAREQIDLAVFDFDLELLADALIEAQQREVQVRMVIDQSNLEAPEVAEVTGRLERAGIPITFDDREAFMHNKFIVIDQRIVWLGSWNMTENDTFRNNNNMLRLRSQIAAEAYGHEFEQLFEGVFGPSKSTYDHPQLRLDQSPVDIYFAPEDEPAQYILAEIHRAKRSIRFMAFSFTSDAIAEAMIDRVDAGVEVHGVMETQNVEGVGSAFRQLRRGDVEVLEDGNCYIMHHKVIIIDDRIVITGSYNFTASAERDNDENLVIISDRELARSFIGEFDRIYAQAQSPTRCR